MLENWKKKQSEGGKPQEWQRKNGSNGRYRTENSMRISPLASGRCYRSVSGSSSESSQAPKALKLSKESPSCMPRSSRYTSIRRRLLLIPILLRLSLMLSVCRVKEHCIQRGLPWDDSLASTSCQEQEYYEDLLRFYRYNYRVSSSVLNTQHSHVLRIRGFGSKGGQYGHGLRI